MLRQQKDGTGRRGAYSWRGFKNSMRSMRNANKEGWMRGPAPRAAGGLLALAFSVQLAAGHKSTTLLVPAEGRAGFTRMGATETGVGFENLLGTNRFTTNQNILNGSGVASGDVDGDGQPDLFFAGLDSANALFRNLGNWKFKNIAEAAGVAMPGLDATGAAFADLDGDGDLDLLVNTMAQGTHLFANDGAGRFARAGVLNGTGAGMSLALADTDGDGDLDLYIANYRLNTIRDEPNAKFEGDFVKGKPVVKSYNGRAATDPDLLGRFTFAANGQVLEHGEPDAYYRNDGGWKFTQVPFDGGAFRNEAGQPIESIPRDWGLSCIFRDLNSDGAPDLYVCNDFESPDRIWMNDGKGGFQAMPALAVRRTCRFSMGIDFADVDRDGREDFFVADMLSRHHLARQTREGIPEYAHAPGEIENRPQYAQNMLYLNRGDGSYAETAWQSGVEASEWTWSPAFLDVDLDGWEDLLVTNGNQHDSMDIDVIREGEQLKKARNMSRMELLALRHRFKHLNSPNLVFRNERDLTFTDRSVEWGFNEAAVSHGMAFADLDGDGDLDVAVNNLNSPASLYRNNSAAPRVAVRLKGAGANTRGIGARIKFAGGPAEQGQEMMAGGRYLAGDEAMRVFAAGSNFVEGRIEVKWRSGKVTAVDGVKANHLYEIAEEVKAVAAAGQKLVVEPAPAQGASAGVEQASASGKTGTWFEDVSSRLRHAHQEELFEDFQRQPLLPMRLSQLGPGISWHDYDQDGWDDLIIPGGRSGKLAVLRNAQNGGFTNLAGAFLQRTVARDQTTALGLGGQLFIGSSNYEDGSTNGGLIRLADMNRQVAGEGIIGPQFSLGPMALADVDGDGSLELFAGGRAIAARYPEPADSILYHNEAGRFVERQRFAKLGLVSGAVFSDFDSDGDADLILACHWGPVRIFQNDKGVFAEATEKLGLAKLTGLWNSIATGDLNGDGRPDLIAGNWGLNTRWRTSAEHPLKLYYGDLDGNGITDLVEARYDAEMQKEVPLRILKTVGPALPFVQEKMQTFAAYGSASVEEIYGDTLKAAQVLQVTTLASMVFINTGSGFEPRKLPPEAQFSPAFGIAVADFDGDANEDVLLAQNFFATNPEMPRSDAGRGLILRGDGQGGLTPVPGQVSGVKVYGEQRGCAAGDFDRDGRVDLAITQNAAATYLYRNQMAKPGVRVRLQGEVLNPAAIGAFARFRTAAGKTVAREIQAGSGYWSVNSPVWVFHGEGGLQLRLPGGKEVSVKLAPGAKEIIVRADGSIEAQ